MLYRCNPFWIENLFILSMHIFINVIFNSIFSRSTKLTIFGRLRLIYLYLIEVLYTSSTAWYIVFVFHGFPIIFVFFSSCFILYCPSLLLFVFIFVIVLFRAIYYCAGTTVERERYAAVPRQPRHTLPSLCPQTSRSANGTVSIANNWCRTSSRYLSPTD